MSLFHGEVGSDPHLTRTLPVTAGSSVTNAMNPTSVETGEVKIDSLEQPLEAN